MDAFIGNRVAISPLLLLFEGRKRAESSRETQDWDLFHARIRRSTRFEKRMTLPYEEHMSF